MNQTPRVLIGAPVKNCGQFMAGWTDQILGLDWPPHLIDVSLLENDSDDDSMDRCLDAAGRMAKAGMGVSIRRTTCGFRLPHTQRHLPQHHEARNAALCALRQSILCDHMNDAHRYVFWFDADFETIPPDTIRRVVESDDDAVAFLLVVVSDQGDETVYDRTTLRWAGHRVQDTSGFKRGDRVPAMVLNGAMAIHRRVISRIPLLYMEPRQHNQQEGPHACTVMRSHGFTRLFMDTGIRIVHATITGTAQHE